MVHAAGESSTGNLPSNTHALVLSVGDESELLRLEGELLDSGVAFHAVRELDPPYNGALMAIGIAPIQRRLFPKCIRKLPLLRGER